MSSQSSEVQRHMTSRSNWQELRLWCGTLGGGVIWLVHLIAAYVISEFGCMSSWSQRSWWGLTPVFWTGLVISGLALLATWWAEGIARGNRRYYVRVNPSTPADTEDGQAFMVRSGILSNRIFMLIIAVQSVPFLFYLYGC